jgi:hypothetical protein
MDPFWRKSLAFACIMTRISTPSVPNIIREVGMVRLGFWFFAKLTLIASRDSSMLFIILLDSGSSVFTFIVAFFLAPLDWCDRLGGEGLRSSFDPDEAEPLSYYSKLSESLSKSENFLLLLAFRLSFFPFPLSCFSLRLTAFRKD